MIGSGPRSGLLLPKRTDPLIAPTNQITPNSQPSSTPAGPIQIGSSATYQTPANQNQIGSLVGIEFQKNPEHPATAVTPARPPLQPTMAPILDAARAPAPLVFRAVPNAALDLPTTNPAGNGSVPAAPILIGSLPITLQTPTSAAGDFSPSIPTPAVSTPVPPVPSAGLVENAGVGAPVDNATGIPSLGESAPVTGPATEWSQDARLSPEPAAKAEAPKGEEAASSKNAVLVIEAGSSNGHADVSDQNDEPNASDSTLNEMKQGLADPTAENRIRPGGTLDARTTRRMAFTPTYQTETAKPAEILSLTGKNGFVAESRADFNSPSRSILANDGSMERFHSRAPSGELLPRIQTTPDFARVESTDPVMESSRTASIGDHLWSAVDSFRAKGRHDWDVKIKPDAATELSLKLTVSGTQLQIVAKVDRGDMNSMSSHWGELQAAFAARGIELKPLESSSQNQNGQHKESEPNFSNLDSSGKRQPEFQQDEQEPFSDGLAALLGNEPRRAVKATAEPAPVEKRSSAILETWA